MSLGLVSSFCGTLKNGKQTENGLVIKTVSIRILPRNRTHGVCVCVCVEAQRERRDRFILEIGSCDHRGWQVQNLQCGPACWCPGKRECSSLSSQEMRCQNFLFFGEGQTFPKFLLRLLTDWLRPIHIMIVWTNLLLFYWFKCYFIFKNFHRTI